jgi:hypothetical protein
VGRYRLSGGRHGVAIGDLERHLSVGRVPLEVTSREAARRTSIGRCRESEALDNTLCVGDVELFTRVIEEDAACSEVTERAVSTSWSVCLLLDLRGGRGAEG